MNHSQTKRTENETLDDYLFRLGSNKELFDLNWNDIKDLMNSESNEDFGESKWRKDYATFKRGYDHAKKNIITKNELINEIEDKTLEFQKERYKFQDQKREYTNIVRQQARFEHLKDEIGKAILEVAKNKPLNFDIDSRTVSTNKRAIALWSDWHYGADFSNSLNTYNPNIFRQRVQKLINKTIEYCKKNNVDEIYVAQLGDSIMGSIHVSTRVQSSEDVIKQIQIVSETIAECVAVLANNFKRVKLINIIGNHSRLISNKTESIFTENLEHLIPWYIESRLKHFKNVEIEKDTDGYYIDESFPEPIVFVHGDLDDVNNTAKVLPQLIGKVPKLICAGHIHHNTVKEHGRTTVVTNGSLMGVDTYAISKRFYATPMQKLMIMDDSDIECTYDVKL